MTKEEFLTRYFDQGSVHSEEIKYHADWGCTVIIVIEHDGTYYMGEVTRVWGAPVVEEYSMTSEPEVVVPRQKVITEYVLPEDEVSLPQVVSRVFAR